MSKPSTVILLQTFGLVACLPLWGSPVYGKEPQYVSNQQQAPSGVVRRSQPVVQSKPASSPWKALFDSFFKRFKPKNPPLGSRGPICQITPGALGQTNTIWSNRPLFLWKGEASYIAVRNYHTNEVLWEEAVPSAAQQLIYGGPTLKPGQTYIWEMISSSEQKSRLMFTVLPNAARQQLVAQRDTLQPQWQDARLEKGMTALQRANFWGEQGLWSDALQALYTTETPTPEAIQSFERISVHICNGTDIFPKEQSILAESL